MRKMEFECPWQGRMSSTAAKAKEQRAEIVYLLFAINNADRRTLSCYMRIRYIGIIDDSRNIFAWLR